MITSCRKGPLSGPLQNFMVEFKDIYIFLNVTFHSIYCELYEWKNITLFDQWSIWTPESSMAWQWLSSYLPSFKTANFDSLDLLPSSGIWKKQPISIQVLHATTELYPLLVYVRYQNYNIRKVFYLWMSRFLWKKVLPSRSWFHFSAHLRIIITYL